jgi:hypothetical protein
MSIDDGQGTALMPPGPSLPSVPVHNQKDGTVSVLPKGGRLQAVHPHS